MEKVTISILTLKWGWWIALTAICIGLICKIGTSVVSGIGIYILIRSVLKIIGLTIRVISYLLSILCLVVLIIATAVFIL